MYRLWFIVNLFGILCILSSVLLFCQQRVICCAVPLFVICSVLVFIGYLCCVAIMTFLL